MSQTATPALKPAFSPLHIGDRSLIWQFGAVLLGTALLALSSYITVPMIPVPITMQTFAVTLIGALYGWRLGGITITAWLIQGAVGLPVLAGGDFGIAHFFGPTGGYLLAFPVCGALVGWLSERGWNGHRVVLAFLAALIGNLLCLVLGAAWLAVMIGVEPAIVHGVLPFVLGGVLKSALAAAVLAVWVQRGMRRQV